MTAGDTPSLSSGPIAWMARHTVAANLVMLMFLLGGLLVSTQIKQEVFPEFQVPVIRVSVAYPGASPEEVEQGLILSIEDAVRGLDGVKTVTSTARENRAVVEIELLAGINTTNVLQDVNNAVERLQSFPELAEQPIISLVEVRHQVLTLMVYGDQEEHLLRDLAERIRDDLLQRPDITLVELGNARPREISIEVPQRALRAYGLTLDRIAREIQEAAIELPGGGLKTSSGEVLLRTQERRDFGRDYARIPLTSTPDGATILVGDLAVIKDGFEETDKEAFYNGQRAIQVKVFRVGEETPQSVSESVHAYVNHLHAELPESIGLAVWNDQSEIYRDRMQLLLKNAGIGLVLVLLLLGLFLDLRLAFWVTVGLPTSIIGSFLFIPMTGASINMISLFAFIITLGIIVDDAVVAGEIIYQQREEGLPFLQAAIAGAQTMAGPITFAVLTNIVAFLPLLFVPGIMGNFIRQIPSVVVAVFVVSLIESLFILPAHLSGTPRASWFWKVLDRPRVWFSTHLHHLIHHHYQSCLRVIIGNRYLTVAIGLAILILAIGTIAGGHIPFRFMPGIDSEIIMAQATLPYGSPIETSRAVLHRLLTAATATSEHHGGASILRGIYAQIGTALPQLGPGNTPSAVEGSHLVGVMVFLVPADTREISGSEFAREWRASIGPIPGLESLLLKAETGPAGGAPIDIQLTHRSRSILEQAAQELAEALSHYHGVTDINDGVSRGKPQMNFQIKPEAQSFLMRDGCRIGHGVRPLTGWKPFGNNADGTKSRSFKFRYTVEQLVEKSMAEAGTFGHIPKFYDETDAVLWRHRANTIIREVTANELETLRKKYPGLFRGRRTKPLSVNLSAMAVGFALALLLIYGLLGHFVQQLRATPLSSCSEPFGIIGALIGVLLGYGLSKVCLGSS